jgi:hypothetical protein
MFTHHADAHAPLARPDHALDHYLAGDFSCPSEALNFHYQLFSHEPLCFYVVKTRKGVEGPIPFSQSIVVEVTPRLVSP